MKGHPISPNSLINLPESSNLRLYLEVQAFQGHIKGHEATFDCFLRANLVTFLQQGRKIRRKCLRDILQKLVPNSLHSVRFANF